MIPLTLQIKNFLSYGPVQTIDFRPHRLICLSGKNGHGKSAMLDAMTWAVWGQARKITSAVKADEGLLRLGQTQMMVVFDFEFNKQTYRIRREFMVTYGKPQAVLEFGVINRETDRFTPLTEKTIRATQEKIESTLGITFDSFSNSSFLRQGHAHEFSKKSPKERKEVLASMLGIDRFEELRKRTSDKVKELVEKRNALLLVQARLEPERAHKDSIIRELQTKKEELASSETQAASLADEQKNIEQRKNELTQKEQAAAVLSFQLARYDQDEQTAHAKLINTRASWKETHRLLLHSAHMNTEHDLQLLREEAAHQQKLLQKSLELKEAYLHCKQEEQDYARSLERAHLEQKQHMQTAVDTQTHVVARHEQMVTQQKQNLSDIERDLQLVTQKAEPKDALLSRISNLQQKLAHEEERFEKRKSYYQRYVTQGTSKKHELEQLKQKQELCHESITDPHCPLCEQNLSTSRKKFLATKLTKHEQTLVHRLRRLSTLVVKLKEVLIAHHAHLAEQKKEIETLTQNLVIAEQAQEQQTNLLAKKAALVQQIQETEQVIHHQKNTLARTCQQLHEMAAQSVGLETHSAYQQLVARRKKLELDMQELGYNQLVHEQVTQRLKDLEQRMNYLGNRNELIARQQQCKTTIHELVVTIKALRKERDSTAQQKSAYDTVTTQRLTLSAHEQTLINTLKELSSNRERLVHEKGSLEAQLKTVEQLDATYETNRKDLEQYQKDLDDYQTLATALGKDGIQALLIEQALPEIEYEANQLLGQLTNNQAHISIESLKDLKRGGTKETLDINISDALGIRPYELFSGGEAFRIDFALRIAISKLLARRSGACLQTLIIDEGFGSQDEEGLNHMTDALLRIQNDFEKIIIVSHLPSMKEQMPVHFAITKTAQGSTVTVVHHA